MGKTLVAVGTLACVPVAAALAQKLLVEYEGTVSSIERASSLAELPPYAVGEPVAGSLTIDLSLAPPDEDADAAIGRYGGAIDFILGRRYPGENAAGDLVVVYDGWHPEPPNESPADGILIRDQSWGTDGPSNLVLGLQMPNRLGELFTTDSLDQSFAVTPQENVSLWGYIERGFGELWRAVDFALSRFSVKQTGVCHAS